MGVFHADQLEILFPIRSFLCERRIAEASFNPYRNPVFVYTRLLDVEQVLVTGNRTFPKRAVIDSVDERAFFAGFHAGFDEITHERNITQVAQPAHRWDRTFHRAMVISSALPTLLASSAPPSLSYGAPGERSIHRGAQARSPDRATATLQKSHIFFFTNNLRLAKKLARDRTIDS